MTLWTHETHAPWQMMLLFSCLVELAASAEDLKNDGEELPTHPTITNRTSDIAALNEEKCLKNRKGCCSETNLGDYGSLMKCFALHEGKIPMDDEKNPAKVIRFYSCFAECHYKEQKYIGKGENINMEMVKSDAQKMYHDRPKEKQFHIELFEFCRKDATVTYNKVKKNPASKFLLGQACKPFFMFVFMCQSTYHQKHRCPYFLWRGKKTTPAVEECKEAKHKCYEIDGLQTPPEAKYT